MGVWFLYAYKNMKYCEIPLWLKADKNLDTDSKWIIIKISMRRNKRESETQYPMLTSLITVNKNMFYNVKYKLINCLEWPVNTNGPLVD